MKRGAGIDRCGDVGANRGTAGNEIKTYGAGGNRNRAAAIQRWSGDDIRHASGRIDEVRGAVVGESAGERGGRAVGFERGAALFVTMPVKMAGL